MYGYGKPTEVSDGSVFRLYQQALISCTRKQRSYWYMQGEFEHDEVHSEGSDAQVCLVL